MSFFYVGIQNVPNEKNCMSILRKFTVAQKKKVGWVANVKFS